MWINFVQESVFQLFSCLPHLSITLCVSAYSFTHIYIYNTCYTLCVCWVFSLSPFQSVFRSFCVLVDYYHGHNGARGRIKLLDLMSLLIGM